MRVVGVGTGSTANFFIDELAKIKNRISGAVSVGKVGASALERPRHPVVRAQQRERASRSTSTAPTRSPSIGAMIKGGGGALTREKIVAAVGASSSASSTQSKLVAVLGRFPLPVEVIPMARSHAARELRRHWAAGRRCATDFAPPTTATSSPTCADLAILNPAEFEDRRCDADWPASYHRGTLRCAAPT